MALYALLNNDRTSIRTISQFDSGLKAKSGFYLPLQDSGTIPAISYTVSYIIGQTGVTRIYNQDYNSYRSLLSGLIITNFQNQVNFALTGLNSTGRDNYIDRLISGKNDFINQLNITPDTGLIYQYTGITNFTPPAQLTGQYDNNYALNKNLYFTGNKVIILSGYADFTYSTIITTNSISGNIINSGINIINILTGFSGQSNINYATVTNLGLSGSNLYNLVTGNSGQSNINFSTITTVNNTGQALLTVVNNNAINLSGNILLTGSNLYIITTGLSGQLNLNHATIPNLALSGSNLYNIITGSSGQGTNNYSTIVNLNTTGSNLYLYITGQSGLLSSNLQLTGQALYNNIIGLSGQASANYATIINLYQTGSNTYNLITGLSGQANTNYVSSTSLITTGSNLYNLVTGLSGQNNINFATVTNLALSGSSLYNIVTGLSGQNVNNYATITNLTTSGSNLYILSTGLSGQLNINHATIVNLSTTGSNLYNIITGLSGVVNSTGNLLSAITVTGSNIINSGNIKGFGSTIVFFSGKDIYISGVGGTGAGVNTLNGLQNTVIAVGSGAMQVSTNGQNILFYDPKPQMVVPFSTTPITWTNMPAAVNFFNATTNYIIYIDLTNYTGINLVVNKGATAGATTGALTVRYTDNPANFTPANYWPITSSGAGEMLIKMETANTIKQSGFFPIVNSAKSGIYIALIGMSGSAAVSPVFGNISAIFK